MSEKVCHLERLCEHVYVARCFSAPAEEWAPDWDWSVTILVDGETARLYAVKGVPSAAQRRALRAELLALGVKEAKWERHKKSGTRTARAA